MPLGVWSESTFQVASFRLMKGDSLFLYTDGLSEATNGDGDLYGEERVEAFARRLNGRTAGAALEDCLEDLDRFRGGETMTDDLTLMMVRRID